MRRSLEEVHLVTDKADCARLFQRGAPLSSRSKEPFNEGNLCRVSFDVHHLQSLSLHTSLSLPSIAESCEIAPRFRIHTLSLQRQISLS